MTAFVYGFGDNDMIFVVVVYCVFSGTFESDFGFLFYNKIYLARDVINKNVSAQR